MKLPGFCMGKRWAGVPREGAAWRCAKGLMRDENRWANRARWLTVYAFCVLDGSLFMRCGLEVSAGLSALGRRSAAKKKEATGSALRTGTGKTPFIRFVFSRFLLFQSTADAAVSCFFYCTARNCRNRGSNIAVFCRRLAEFLTAMENFRASMQVAHAAISPFKGRKNICLRIRMAGAIN